MSENRFKNMVEKNLLNGNNLSISAPCPTADKKWSNLSFKVINGNPRIVVYTNDPDDKIDNGIMNVRMHPLIFQTFIDLWRDAITKENGWREALNIDEYDWSGGRRSEKPEMRWRIVIGKSNDGIISITILDKKHERRPRIAFEIKAPRFISLLGQDGEPMKESEQSIRFSRSWTNLLQDISNHLQVITWKEPVKRDKKDGNSYSSNKGSSYSEDRMDDEDIPF